MKTGAAASGSSCSMTVAKRSLTRWYASQSGARKTGRTCASWHSGQSPSLAKPS